MKHLLLVIVSLYSWNVLGLECKSLLEDERVFTYTNVWSHKKSSIDFSKYDQVNGLLIQVVSDFFLEKGKAPSVKELDKLLTAEGHLKNGVKKYLEDFEETPNSINHILKVSVDARRKGFYNDVKQNFRLDFVKFFEENYRQPGLTELAEVGGVEPEILEAVVGPYTVFLEKMSKRDEAKEAFEKARTFLTKLFIRTIKQTDTPEQSRTQSTTPTVEDLFDVLKNMPKLPKALLEGVDSGRFTIEVLMHLIGEGASEFEGVKLFSGMKELENRARKESPASFKGYLPKEVYDPLKVSALKDALEQKQGVLVTSVNAGMPLNEAMFATMLKYAKDMDYAIVIYPTGGILDGIDESLLNNNRVHLLTHTIENEALKLWNIPILPKNQNALASLSNPGQHLPMQTVIVGNPQLRLFNVPTATNHLRPTDIWSTGSLSDNYYPFRHAVQGRTSQLAKNNHDNGFLVLEKSDGEAGFTNQGSSNHWHVRPVYFYDDLQTPVKEAGFNDLGRRYFVESKADDYKMTDVKVKDYGAETLVLGDLHERVADQAYLKVILQFIRKSKSLKRIVLHDPIDGGSHNHHESRNIALLVNKFLKGELDYHSEMMGTVQFVNALTTAKPDLNIIMVDSNHSYWGKALVTSSGSSDLQNVLNGQFLNELRNASNVYETNDPLTYVFQNRNDYIDRLPEPAKTKYLSRVTLVEHPERVSVLRLGQNFVVGPDHRPNHFNFHGHQGSGGAKGSPKTHSIGALNSTTADSHQSLIGANGWMSVGTTTPLKVGFNDGGYGAWSNSFAVVYPDGSKQLMIYSSETGTVFRRRDRAEMTPSEFFGDKRLQIVPNDNDVVTGFIVDQHSTIIDHLSEKGLTEN